MFSVVLNTFNRVALLPRALESVLAQDYPSFEVVVTDDGSTDATPELLRGWPDGRIRYVRQDNAGLSAARNFGARAAAGVYLTFLDDDDEVSPGWLAAFASAIDHGSCGIACCGVEVRETGRSAPRIQLPGDLGPVFDNCVGLFLAGTFAVRRDLFFEAGGYSVDLPCSHQTELALRVVPLCSAQGLRVEAVFAPNFVMHRAEASDRPRNDPARLLACTSFILERHAERLGRSPRDLASYLAIAGVSAARLGQYGAARRYFARSVACRPSSAKNVARLLAAIWPPLGRRLWAR